MPARSRHTEQDSCCTRRKQEFDDALRYLCVLYDSAAALIQDGRIALLPEAKFTRKTYAGISAHAITYCLEESGLSIDELSAVVLTSRCLLERLLRPITNLL